MPFSGGPDTTVPFTVNTPAADTPIPFTHTLAVVNTAEDFVTIPVGKAGQSISLINLGPGSAFIQSDAPATLASIEVKAHEAYSEDKLSVATAWSFIGETGKKPVIRGVVWAG